MTWLLREKHKKQYRLTASAYFKNNPLNHLCIDATLTSSILDANFNVLVINANLYSCIIEENLLKTVQPKCKAWLEE